MTARPRVPIITPRPPEENSKLTNQWIARVSAPVAAAALAAAATAQGPGYGTAVDLDTAKKLAAAAAIEAKKNSWPVAIAIVDNHGTLVYYEMLDDTQTASANVSIEKVRASAMFRRPSKAFEDAVAGGRVAVPGLTGAMPIDGGLPIVVAGKVIGAIGVSGVTSQQDAQVARAGIDALK
ncbi:MAG: heme-binding protein [Burkholderiales bacterium]|jgi:uncharacterized protein GlcG (DUF336 family)|nr:heme-binding protein [Burkholderiales bacterium]